MSKTKEFKYIRYVGTTTFTRISERLEAEMIQKLIGKRSWRDDNMKSKPPVPYIKATRTENNHFEMRFCQKTDGILPFEQICQYLDDSGVKDFSIDRIDLLVPKEVDVGSLLADRGQEYIEQRGKRFIAVYEKYLGAWDGGENQYTEFLTQHRDNPHQLESKLRIHPASLDFQYVIPTQNWVELNIGRVNERARNGIEKWRSINQSAVMKSVARKVTESIFPLHMQSSRQYELVERGRWVLQKHGNF